MRFYGQKTHYTMCMSLYGAPSRQVFKMASLAVTCMLSSNLWYTKSQRSGQVYLTVYQGRLTTAPRLVESVCVYILRISNLRALEMDGMIEQCDQDSPSLRSPIAAMADPIADRHQSPKQGFIQDGALGNPPPPPK